MSRREPHLTRCYIQARHGEAGMFRVSMEGVISVYLDRYAIIPMEQYDRFVVIAEEWAKLKLREVAADD